MNSNNGSVKRELPFEDVKKIVSPFVKNNYIVESCEIKSVGGKAIGFQGEYFIITVVINVEGEKKKYEYFLKSLPSDVERAQKLKDAGYHRRELNVYMKIFSEIDKVQKTTGYHARCFHVTDEIIILENLFQHGYKITSSTQTFDRDHCQVAVSSLAKLHAGSLILEETKTKETGREFRIVNEFEHILTECGYNFDDAWFIAGMETAITIAGESEKYGKDTKYFDTVVKKWNAVFKQALEMFDPLKTTRNVMCHRDLWANNLMFNYKDGKPNNCVIIDYQASCCMPPMGDLVTLLFLNLSSKQRECLFDEMIKYYYDTLSKELESHTIDIKDIYLWNDFKNLCESYKLLGAVQTIILHQLAILKYEDVTYVLGDDYDLILNVSRKDFILNIMKNDPLYRMRMLDTVDDLIIQFIIKE